jgi:hypothetical protein
MRKFCIGILIILSVGVRAQELYPNSEPASIIPMNAVGVRLMNEGYIQANNLRSWHGAMFMYGLSPKLMFSAMLTTSNHHRKVLPQNFVEGNSAEGYSVSHNINPSYQYLFESVNVGFRYRFLNRDGDHRHFRMAVYGNAVYSDRPHDEAEITLMGDNKGVGGGVISTLLLHKLAISLTGGMVKPFAHRDASGIRLNYGNAYNYSLSFGYLVYPFKYQNYKQTNINLYAEFLGKTYERLQVSKDGQPVNAQHFNTFDQGSFVEFRPAIQFIVKSNLRIDCSTIIPVVNRSYIRKYPSYLLNLQYYFFL